MNSKLVSVCKVLEPVPAHVSVVYYSVSVVYYSVLHCCW